MARDLMSLGGRYLRGGGDSATKLIARFRETAREVDPGVVELLETVALRIREYDRHALQTMNKRLGLKPAEFDAIIDGVVSERDWQNDKAND